MSTEPPVWRWRLVVCLWFVAVVAGLGAVVGLVDLLAGGSALGHRLRVGGAGVFGVCVTAMVALRPWRRDAGRKLFLVAFGTWPFASFLLFLYWQIGLSIEQYTACEAGDAAECHALAVRKARRGKLDIAAGLFESGCDGGIAESCYRLAALYEQGRGVDPDRTRAVALYEEACAEVPLACAGAAELLRHEDVDPAHLTGLWQTACEGGVQRACAELPDD